MTSWKVFLCNKESQWIGGHYTCCQLTPGKDEKKEGTLSHVTMNRDEGVKAGCRSGKAVFTSQADRKMSWGSWVSR